jgi:Cu-Zn family superoxide dismutase
MGGISAALPSGETTMKAILLSLVAAVALCACESTHDSDNKPKKTGDQTASKTAEVTRAEARLAPASGSQVTGTVTFTKKSDGIEVHAHIEHLTPGKHGFHVHEKGDCSAADASSAGGHFNPDDHKHGDRTVGERHVGDLGNIEANSNGVADVTFVDTKISLSGKNSVIGRALIVHTDPDDLKTQPTGASGGRVACGVIEKS